MKLPNFVPMHPQAPPRDSRERAQALHALLTQEQWAMELKYDGFRGIVYFDGTSVRISTKTQKVFRNFSNLASMLTRVFKQAGVTSLVLDGEMVCMDERACPSFEALIFRKLPIRFQAFDLLYMNGRNTNSWLYETRKRQLEKICKLAQDPILLYASYVVGSQEKADVYLRACEKGLEGVVFKHRRSRYGDPNFPWYKFICPGYAERYKSRAVLFNQAR